MSLNLVEALSDYEAGELEPEQVEDLFQRLLDEGTLPLLQGAYGRMAQRLLAEGRIVLHDHDEVEE